MAEALSPVHPAKRERGALAVLALSVDLGRRPELGAALTAALGAPPPGPGMVAIGRYRVLWRTPREQLVLCAPAEQPEALAALRAAAGPAALVNDVSSAVATLDLRLERARTLLPSVTAAPIEALMDPRGGAMTTRLAHVRATLARFPDEQSVLLLVASPDAEHVGAMLARAAALSD